ncbi:MAG: LptF/LptG family permease [Acidobacteriota bacterium]
MIGIIDRSITKEILPYFLLSLLLLTAIIFIHEANRFSELFIIFSRRGLDGWPLVELIVSLLPSILVFTLPIALLFGILIGLGRMAADSELIVLRASGVGRWRLFLPIFILAIAVSLLTCYNTAYLLPNAMRSLHSLKNTRAQLLLRGMVDQVKPGVFEENIPNKVIFIRNVERVTGRWRQIFLAEQLDPLSEPRILIAKDGELQLGPTLERSELNLYNGIVYDAYVRKRRDQSKATAYSFAVSTLRFDLSTREDSSATTPPQPPNNALNMLNEGPQMWALPELLRAPWPAEREKQLQLLAERHKRFALPCACLVFAFAGVALGMRVTRGGRASGLIVSIAVTLTYYLLFILGEDISRQGFMPVVLGIWLPNLMVALFGLFMLTQDQWLRDRIAGLWSYCEPTWRRLVNWFQGERQRINTNRVIFGFPRLIDRMIVLELGRYFFIVLTGITTVFIVFTLFELAENIVENKISSGVVASYLFFLLPQVLHYATPFAVLVSVLVTFGLFGKTSELIALNTSGQSLYRLALPALLYSIITGACLFTSQEYLLPFANRRQEYLRYLIKGGQLPAQTFYQKDRKWFAGQGNRIIHFQNFDRDRNRIVDMAIYELDEQSTSLVRRISARLARWDAQTHEWILQGVFLRTFEGAQVKTAEYIKQMRLALPEQPDYFKQQVPESSKMSMTQLFTQIEQLQMSGIDVLDLRIALQTKVANPLTCLVMVLMGLPFALTVGKRGALAGVGVSIFIAIIFWGVLELFGQLGRYELLPPLLSAWGPNLLFSASGLYLLFTART